MLLYPSLDETNDILVLHQLLPALERDAFFPGVLLQQWINRHDQGAHELTLIADNSDLLDIIITAHHHLDRLRRDIFPV